MPNQVEMRKKILAVPLEKDLFRTETGTVVKRGFFTSDNRDEVGDIITRSATERALPKYKRWGNIRLMHQPIPVGKVLRIGVEDGLDWNEVEIEVIDPAAIFMVENGLLQALSVGILINFEDIDFLEDGGWIINDYALAEISLVDHPANYDAFLKELPVDQGLQMMVRQYGFDAVAGSMQEYLKKEIANMPENVEKDAVEEVQQEEPEVEKVIEAEDEVIEEPTVETEELSVEAEVEKDLTAEDIEAAVVETEEQEVEDVEAEEQEPEEAVEEPELELDIQADVLKTLVGKIDSLTAEVVALKAALEAKAEVPQAEEQPESNAQEEKEAAILNEEDIEPEDVSPANRKGALPDGDSASESEEGRTSKTASLNEALAKYFESKNKRK